MAYPWLGNIRELEHVVERNVLLAKDSVIDNVILPTLPPNFVVIEQDERLKTIYENERDHIIGVLKRCSGRVWGPGGAAEILNVPPSTLKSKMKKLGIQKEAIDL